jgi:hypothetical protein
MCIFVTNNKQQTIKIHGMYIKIKTGSIYYVILSIFLLLPVLEARNILLAAFLQIASRFCKEEATGDAVG